MRPADGTCSQWIGSELRYCRGGDTTRYQHGYRCPAHDIRIRSGLPPLPESPGIPAYRTQPEALAPLPLNPAAPTAPVDAPAHRLAGPRKRAPALPEESRGQVSGLGAEVLEPQAGPVVGVQVDELVAAPAFPDQGDGGVAILVEVLGADGELPAGCVANDR